MVLVSSPRPHSRSWRNVHTQAPLPARSFLPVSGSILHATRIALLSVTPRTRAMILVRAGCAAAARQCRCGTRRLAGKRGTHRRHTASHLGVRNFPTPTGNGESWKSGIGPAIPHCQARGIGDESYSVLSSIAFDILSRMSGWAAMKATFSALVVEGSAVSAFMSPCFRIWYTMPALIRLNIVSV